MTSQNQVKGQITRRCLDELREFGATLREGERRDDIWVSVCRRWPLEEHSNASGAAFGIYGDLSDTVARALLAIGEEFKFYIYIPDQEIALLENGIFWLNRSDTCTVLLSNKSQALDSDQGDVIPFTATWNRF